MTSRMPAPTLAAIHAAYWQPRARMGITPGEDAATLRASTYDGAPTMADVAAQFGVSQSVVWRAVHGRSYDRTRTYPRRSRQEGLRPSERQAVVAAYAEGVPVCVIAEIFRLSRTRVWRLGAAAGLPPRRGRLGVSPGITAATYLARLQTQEVP
jgi:hypothetical protein